MIVFSEHAFERMEERGADRWEVRQTVLPPPKAETGSDGTVYGLELLNAKVCRHSEENFGPAIYTANCIAALRILHQRPCQLPPSSPPGSVRRSAKHARAWKRSTQHYAETDFQARQGPFMQNVREEGIER